MMLSFYEVTIFKLYIRRSTFCYQLWWSQATEISSSFINPNGVFWTVALRLGLTKCPDTAPSSKQRESLLNFLPNVSLFWIYNSFKRTQFLFTGTVHFGISTDCNSPALAIDRKTQWYNSNGINQGEESPIWGRCPNEVGHPSPCCSVSSILGCMPSPLPKRGNHISPLSILFGYPPPPINLLACLSVSLVWRLW